MRVRNPLAIWEAALTGFASFCASLSLANILPAKLVALMVIISTALHMGTQAYRIGQHNPVTPPAQPVQLTVAQPATPDPHALP